jgi:hypothetical protein
MPFVKKEDLLLSELPIPTLYRFAEIELLRAYSLGLDPTLQLENLEPPTKEELIDYLKYHGVGQKRIAQIVKCSLSTISERKNTIPNYYPSYNWQHIELVLWDAEKKKYNLWQEKLIHMEGD